MIYLMGLFTVLFLAFPAGAGSPVRSGNRIADQLRMYGYVETLLLQRSVGQPVSIRNLGWAGDMLTARDWHAKKLPWHQEVVAETPAFNGHWEIDVAKAGTYRITLMERPSEAKFPIKATKATLNVGGKTLSKKIVKGAPQVSFEIKLKPGRTQLSSTIVDDAGTERGAYYASVQRR